MLLQAHLLSLLGNCDGVKERGKISSLLTFGPGFFSVLQVFRNALLRRQHRLATETIPIFAQTRTRLFSLERLPEAVRSRYHIPSVQLAERSFRFANWKSYVRRRRIKQTRVPFVELFAIFSILSRTPYSVRNCKRSLSKTAYISSNFIIHLLKNAP